MSRPRELSKVATAYAHACSRATCTAGGDQPRHHHAVTCRTVAETMETLARQELYLASRAIRRSARRATDEAFFDGVKIGIRQAGREVAARARRL